MTKEVTEWFLNEFWVAYPKDLTPSNDKGSRAISLKLMLKHNPDEEERARILGNLKAQIRSSRKQTKPKWWKIADTYIRNGLWDDEIESEMEIKQKRADQFCHCGEETIGPGYSVCAKHTESHAQRLKMMSILKQIGVATPGQSLQELSQSCREYLRTNGGSRKLFQEMISSEKALEPGNQ